jgi:hypothetical protein
MGGCSGNGMGSNHKSSMPKFPAPPKSVQMRATQQSRGTTRQSYKPGNAGSFGKPSVKMNFGMGKKY